tara:strand:+ start:154 stop:372 length:219 start_codon:yes stop_codon:yes gene_type:complete
MSKEKINELEKRVLELDKYIYEEVDERIDRLEKTLKEFMDNWGPEVQKRRDERDAKWDEMVSVLTIQNRGKK